METNSPIPSDTLVGSTEDSTSAIAELATELIDLVDRLQVWPGIPAIGPGMAAQVRSLRLRAEKLFEDS